MELPGFGAAPDGGQSMPSVHLPFKSKDRLVGCAGQLLLQKSASPGQGLDALTARECGRVGAQSDLSWQGCAVPFVRGAFQCCSAKASYTNTLIMMR